MTDTFQTFQKFNDPQLAEVIAQKLKELNIPSKIEEENFEFNASFIKNTVESSIHLKVRTEDFDRANQALEDYYQQHINEVDPDYYLFSFTDQELLDIISKPDEWGHFDYALAKRLLTDRGLTITPGAASDLKQQRLEELARPEPVNRMWIIIGYALALVGGFFWPIYGSAIGAILGYTFSHIKKTLPNGQTVLIYPEEVRRHGKIIFFAGIAGIIFWLIFLFFYHLLSI